MTTDAATEAEAALRQAHALHRAGRLEAARALCLRALELRPRQPEALVLLGIIAAQTGDLERAVGRFDEALELDPRSFAAQANRGHALRALGRPAAALASYEAAIALRLDHAPSHNSRGKALLALRRHEDAVASHDEAIRLQPNYVPAHFDRALALVELGQHPAALASLEAALALDPTHAGAWYVRANALYSMGRFEAALQSYDRVIALRPSDARAYHNRGNALLMLERPGSAVASYDQALALDPDMQTTAGARLHARMHVADWRGFAPEVARLEQRIERGEAASNPFVVLALRDCLPLQRRAAQNWVREHCPPSEALPALPARRPREPHEKLRVGYFSAEFHGHATAALTMELFEIHDRSRLELTAFSLGPDTRDEQKARLAAAFDRFLEVGPQSDLEIARLARSLAIDIAVDLGGFTRGGRPGIFALRAAPVQVGYLGYLGTMSADYMDYLIADETIVPETQRQHYREQIVYLPSYQVNDSKRRIAPERLSREALGLPPAGFVFCCFNSIYKITPDTFDSWMRILARVPGSVLFLLDGGGPVQANLRREARERGIEPHRLIFGPRLPAPQYMARYRAADLFLDTLPYNAGTTASDALWAGLPVLTRAGEAFASRIGASLLTAVGLPELITSTAQQYEDRAVALASDPQTLAGFRARLEGDLRATRLFDTAAFARHLEAAYATLVERYEAGLPPDIIRVPA